MKTELEKAEILFDRYVNEGDYSKRKMCFGECYGHFQTCKSWLEFIREIPQNRFFTRNNKEIDIKGKIFELQETIKFYEEKGIQ